MDAPTNNNTNIYTLPDEILLRIVQLRPDNLSSIRRVDTRLNAVVNLWFIDVMRELRKDVHLDRRVTYDGALVLQFKRFMKLAKKEGVALTCDQKERVQSLNSESQDWFQISRGLASVRRTYQESSMIQFVKEVARVAGLETELNQFRIDGMYELPFVNTERAFNHLLQNTRITTLSSLVWNTNILIPAEINSLTSLQALDIDNNRFIQSLPSLNGLVLLNILDIHLCPNLESLPCLTTLTRLQHLTLCALENVTHFPACETLTLLQTLNLNLPAIEALPACFINFSLLVNIKLSNMGKVCFWPTITEMPQIEQLAINDCDLAEVPLALSQLTNLLRLDLSFNQITNLPDICGSFGRLRVLNITTNCISQLPPSFSMLTALQELSSSLNELTQVPDLSNCTALQELSLKYNQIRSLPDYLTRLTQLTNVSLKNNPLQQEEIPEALKTNPAFKFV